MTAANRFGLYSALRACKAILFKSSLHPRFTVDTMFCNWGMIGVSDVIGVKGVRGVIGPPGPTENISGVPGAGESFDFDLSLESAELDCAVTLLGAGDIAEANWLDGVELGSWWTGCMGDG